MTRGTIVRVPFPYTARTTTQHRPALVIAAPSPADAPSLVWVLMITSAANRAWLDDVPLPQEGAITGLRSASIIRCRKITTIDAHRADRIGVAPADVMEQVLQHVRSFLGLAS